MKIIYCNHSIYNPGGMERVMINKIIWLVEHTDWDVKIVTTDQKGRPSFYPLPSKVEVVDLGINYSDDNQLSTFGKVKGYLKRRKLHKERLTRLLMQEKADIVVSLFPCESSFIPDIKDGSKKVLELHFNKYFRLQYGRTGLYGLINQWRTKQDEKLVRKFDKFVVLTEEDKGYWGNTGNICVIPNAVTKAQCSELIVKETVEAPKRVLAVGRLDYQKGFDRLIDAWAIVAKEQDLKDWHLDIFGQGEWKGMLNNMIAEKGLTDSATIHTPTKNILEEYRKSKFLVMSSHYEGFPMVMIEAMSQGLPVVSFDFKCGPKDIIQEGLNGMIVPDGNVYALANTMIRMMRNTQARENMAKEAMKVTERFSEDKIMKMWTDLFNNLYRA